MRKSLVGAVVALALALPPAVAQATTARAMGVGRDVVVVVAAGPYRLTLRIGPMEPMYTLAQYNSMHPHPTRGEIILRGAMMTGGMGMEMPNRHLEVHIVDSRNGRVLGNEMVSITYQRLLSPPVRAMIAPRAVPVAVMRGIGMDMSDIHYGNNVAMAPGRYRVAVNVAGNRIYAYYIVQLV